MFTEIAPHPILGGGVQDLMTDSDIKGTIISSMSRKIEDFEAGVVNEMPTFIKATFDLSFAGGRIDWRGFYPAESYFVRLPSYPWQLVELKRKRSLAAIPQPGHYPHPLLGNHYISADNSVRSTWNIILDKRVETYLPDHSVDGTIIFPGTGHMEIATAVGRLLFGKRFAYIEDLYFNNAIFVDEEDGVIYDTRLEITSEEGDFKIFSRRDKNSEQWIHHSGGRINFLDHPYSELPDQDLAALKARIRNAVDIEQYYADLKEMGLEYGPSFRLLSALDFSGDEILAEITLGESISHGVDRYHIHPAIVDASLHAILAKSLSDPQGSALYLPRIFGAVKYFVAPKDVIYSYIRITGYDKKYLRGEFIMMNPDGAKVAEIKHATFMYLEGSRKNVEDDVYHGTYAYQWVPVEMAGKVATSPKILNKILVFNVDTPFANDLTRRLKGLHHHVSTVRQGVDYCAMSDGLFRVVPQAEENFNTLLQSVLKDGQVLDEIIYLWGLDTTFGAESSNHEIESQTDLLAASCIHLVKALAKMDFQGRMTFVTRALDTVVANDHHVNFGQAVLLGVARVLSNENPDIDVRMIDIGLDDGNAAYLFSELAVSDNQEKYAEIALRGSQRYYRKLIKVTAKSAREYSRKQVSAAAYPFIADIENKGVLDSLIFRQHVVGEPCEDEVVVEVRATGLNVNDVANAMEAPNFEAVREGYAEGRLGLEISGIVRLVGASVTKFKPGDAVLGWVPYGIAGYTKTKAHMLAHKPIHLSFIEAASTIVAFMTAYYGLNYLARMSFGERILIHSTVDGVDVAAIGLAKLVGAQIYATVGSAKKGAYLKHLGIKHIYDSQHTHFYKEIMRDTDGQGVDIVLNSLTGNAIEQSFKCLSAFGRFIEIGKTDVYANKQLGLKRLGKNISYFVVNMDPLLTQKKELGGRILQETVQLFAEKKLVPHPIKTFPVKATADALRYFVKGNYIGKLVLSITGEIPVVPTNNVLRVDPNGAYLITGGASGLGLQYAKLLVDRGARYLMLLSRSGIKNNVDRAIVDEFIIRGVEVELPKLDVTDFKAMKQAIESSHLPHVSGIIHSAGTMQDTILTNMTMEVWKRVYSTKVIGAWNLHNLFKENELEFFLLVSSVSAILGLPGQANYSAANNTLDRIAMYRRGINQKGSSINLGLLGEFSGMMGLGKEDPQYLETVRILEREGLDPMSLTQVLAKTERLLLDEMTYRQESNVDWGRFGNSFPNQREDSRFRHLFTDESSNKSEGGAKSSIREITLSQPVETRPDYLQAQMREALTHILGTTPDKIVLDVGVSKIGLDSLMLNQLRNWIQNKLEMRFPLMKIAKGPSIIELVEMILEEIQDDSKELDTGSDQQYDSSGITGNQDLVVSDDKWFIHARGVNEDAPVRIICMHPVGAGATIFSHFMFNPIANAQLFSMQQPGRENRADEPIYEDMTDLVAKIAEVMEPYLDRPTVLWGHSWGFMCLFEAYRKLRREGSAAINHVFHLVTTGTIAPSLVELWKERDAIQASFQINNTVEKIMGHLKYIDDREFLASIIPIMKKDMQNVRPYRVNLNEPKLTIPILGFTAAEDEVVTPKEFKLWEKETQAGFEMEVVHGDHWFLTRNRDFIGARIGKIIENACLKT